MEIPLPPDVLGALGLGPHFTIGPVAFAWATVDLRGVKGSTRVYVLIMEDSNGRHGYVFGPDEASDFGRKALHASTNLVVASSVPTKGTNDE